jgi:hypothetical protein
MKRIIGLAVLIMVSVALQASDWRAIEAQRRLEADRAARDKRYAQESALQRQGIINAARVSHTPDEWKAVAQQQQENRTAATAARAADQATAEALARADIASATATAKKAELERSKVWFIVSMFLGVGLLGWIAGWIIRSCNRQYPARIRISAG